MAHGRHLVSLGELLDEHADTKQEKEILDRLKVLAQEHFPDGWTKWEATTATKEDVFGEKIDPKILNKLVYALPTVGLARAFVPDTDHLSEKGYREIRSKLLDWASTRSLIFGPPAIANRIRGSVRTELFKQSIEVLRPLLHTRSEADRILSGNLSEKKATNRKRRSTSTLSISQEPIARKRKVGSPFPSSKYDARFEALENKMENMLSMILEKNQKEQVDSDSYNENYYSDVDNESILDALNSPPWRAPNLTPCEDWPEQDIEKQIEFLPTTKEADPLVPEPSTQLKNEGIECQRLGTEGWNRIRYKEVEKHLHAASVFSALKINTELGTLHSQPSPWISKQEGMLGTITHGLLLQRRALAESLKIMTKKFPSASAELKQLVAENSKFRVISDQLLQFVCAHRAETIEFRRKVYKPRIEFINCAMHTIPPFIR